MRTLIRLILVWAVLAPLSFYVGLPYLTQMMQHHAREQTITQCLTQTASQPATFPPAQPAIAQGYCDCVAAGVVLTRSDIFTIALHKPPLELNKRVETQVNLCNDRLQNPASGDAQTIQY